MPRDEVVADRRTEVVEVDENSSTPSAKSRSAPGLLASAPVDSRLPPESCGNNVRWFLRVGGCSSSVRSLRRFGRESIADRCLGLACGGGGLGVDVFPDQGSAQPDGRRRLPRVAVRDRGAGADPDPSAGHLEAQPAGSWPGCCPRHHLRRRPAGADRGTAAHVGQCVRVRHRHVRRVHPVAGGRDPAAPDRAVGVGGGGAGDDRPRGPLVAWVQHGDGRAADPGFGGALRAAHHRARGMVDLLERLRLVGAADGDDHRGLRGRSDPRRVLGTGRCGTTGSGWSTWR